ncbi:hypothetical protein ACFLVE_03120 [Chloroflexota bacterium]
MKKGKLSNENRRYGQIEVITDWRDAEDISPAFIKLMTLLLTPREEQRDMGNGEKDGKRAE